VKRRREDHVVLNKAGCEAKSHEGRQAPSLFACDYDEKTGKVLLELVSPPVTLCIGTTRLHAMGAKEPSIFCDVHREVMQMVGYRWGMSLHESEDKYFCSCTHEGCTRHFSPDHGYVDIRDKSMDVTERLAKQCPKGHGSMAIIGFNSQSDFDWKCVHRECRYLPD
jgi:hypothetical protein